MKKIICLFLLLGGCTTVPTPTHVVDNLVPIPVLCKQTVKKQIPSIDDAKPNLPLEEQNVILRTTIAQQKSYIVELEAGVVGCGGIIEP